MSLLGSPYQYSDSMIEGYVTTVIPDKYVCSVRTNKGQYLSEVQWLVPTGGAGKAGIHLTPNIGDQVVISTALGYPIIVGCLPRLGLPSTNLTNVSGETVSVDVGSSSNLKNGYVTNPGKPSDFVPGDVVVASEGGAIIAALDNGSVIARASLLAQIFLSKFNDLVRVVARNWERFSDAGQHTSANVKGRLYEFLGWDRDLSRSKTGLYELQDVVGDVAIGEVLLGDPNASVALPVADTRLRKYWLKDDAGISRMVEVLYEDGKLTLLVQNELQTTKTTKTTEKDIWSTKVENPSGHSQVVITPASVTVTHSGGATSIHDVAGIRSSFSGHFVNIDASGVHMG